MIDSIDNILYDKMSNCIRKITIENKKKPISEIALIIKDTLVLSEELPINKIIIILCESDRETKEDFIIIVEKLLLLHKKYKNNIIHKNLSKNNYSSHIKEILNKIIKTKLDTIINNNIHNYDISGNNI